MLPFIAPIIATLSSYAGTVAQALVKIAPTIASALGKMAPMLEKVAKPILEIAPKIGDLISTVINMISEISKILGLVKGNTAPDELGERALQHPEISLDDCGSVKEYIEKLESADFDAEKFQNLSSGERAMAVAVGAGIETIALAERFKMDIPVQFFELSAKGGMTTSDVIKLLGALSENGIRDAGLIVDYLTGSLSPERTPQVSESIARYEADGGKPIAQVEADIANGVALKAPVPELFVRG